MSNVFVSYGRESMAIAKALASDIRALGHEAWFDQELTGGQAWWDQILSTVRNCDVFVFVLTPQSLHSIACMGEYGYAAALRRPILPVLVADGVSTNLLPPVLSQIQFVDYRNQDRDSALRLARALATIQRPGPLPDPLPEPPDVPISYLGGITAQIETRSTLSYEQQSAVVVDLRRGLRDPETVDDARALLARLRKRRDLLATIADEVDELLRSVAPASLTEPRVAPISTAQTHQLDRPPSIVRDAGRLEAMEGQVAHGSSEADPDQARMRKGHIKFAVAGAILGLAIGIIPIVKEHEITLLAWALVPGIGLAIAGAISGPRRIVLALAVGCAVLGWYGSIAVGGDKNWAAAILLGIPGGAIVGAIIGAVREWSRARKASSTDAKAL